MEKFLSRFTKMASLLIGCLFSAALSAQEWQGLQWTNGTEMLVAEQLNSSQVLLVGNGFFDAGYGYLLDVKQTGDESYEMTSSPKPQNMPKDKSSIAYNILANDQFNGTSNFHWKRKEVRGIDLLMQYNGEGKLISLYTATGEDLKEHAEDQIKQLILGNYKDAQGRTWTFEGYENVCVWGGKKTNYEIDRSLGAPDFGVKVDGKLYALVLTMEGMNVYEAQKDEEGWSYRHIRQVASLVSDKSEPRFPEISLYPCDSYAISLLKTDMLNLLRNEIYARKGWVFKDAKLNAYFQACSWYKPVADNSQVQLNEMELLNVSLLRYYENMSK